MTDVRQRNAIRAYCAARQIDTLVHFTRLENLAGILADGLLPRSTLERQARSVVFNDEIRTDGHKDAVCLSISFPNYKMFYRLSHTDPAVTWAVLSLRADVLWELDCAFCWANAACNAIRKLPLAKLRYPLSLAKMFADPCATTGISRKACDIPDSHPTNPQAEVLAFSRIPLTYITGLCFKDQGGRSKFVILRRMGLPVEVNSAYFRPRSDWQVWQPSPETNPGE
jgi:ssDNA thymidine ADP-ribosyltransferase, DarT